jgi:hypothetical protein
VVAADEEDDVEDVVPVEFGAICLGFFDLGVVKNVLSFRLTVGYLWYSLKSPCIAAAYNIHVPICGALRSLYCTLTVRLGVSATINFKFSTFFLSAASHFFIAFVLSS